MIRITEQIRKTCLFRVIFENMINFIDNLKEHQKKDVWEVLLSEGNHDLIRLLRRAENKEEGFGTIIVPKEGFSKNSSTNKLVLDWLEEHNINILDVEKEKKELKETLNLKKPNYEI